MNPLDLFKYLFENLVYNPQLNLLQFFYNLTKDTGVSIILVAISVNLLLWKVIVDSYLSGIKMRILQPQMKLIQDKYKTKSTDEPAKIFANAKLSRQEIGQLYKQHKVKTGVFFWVIFLQLFFASGVFYVVNNVSNSVKNGQSIPGIYESIFGYSQTRFPETAFGFLKIDVQSTNYIWLPIGSMILSYLYGKYVFQWAPNAKIANTVNMAVGLPKAEDTPIKKTKKADKVVEIAPAAPEFNIDPAALQRNQEFMIIYIMPIVTLFINSNFSAGLNLYFATLSLFNLVRQIIITQYYASHVTQLIKDIADSDPTSKDNNPDNDLDSDVDIASLADNSKVTAVVK